MEEALRAKIVWAKQDLDTPIIDKLIQDLIKDNLTSVDQLKLLSAQDLTSRYNLPFFTALELAQKFQMIGSLNKTSRNNEIQTQASEATNTKFKVKWDKMPPNLIKDIAAGRIPTESDRRKLVARIVEDVRHEVPFAERSLFSSIAQKIEVTFPGSFGDILVRSRLNKAVSLAKQLKDCFDNAKRGDKTAMEIEAPASEPRAYGCRKWRLHSLPEGETTETQEETRKELVEIYTKTRTRDWDWAEILEKLNTTYGTLRKEINMVSKVILELQKADSQGRPPKIPRGVDVNDCVVSKITENWPFLFQVRSVTQHFETLTGVNISRAIETFLADYGNEVIDFFMQVKKCHGKIKVLKRLYDKNRNVDNEKNIKLLTIILMVGTYFNENSNSWLFRVDEGLRLSNFNEKYDLKSVGKTPIIFAIGKFYTTNKFFVSLDQQIETSVKNFFDAFVISFSYFYIFGINYPEETSLTMDFAQRGMVGINPKRGTKTTSKNKTKPATTISSRLLTLFRKINFSFQEDQVELDLHVEEFNFLEEQMVDDL